MLQYLLDLVIYCVVSCINWIIQTIGDLIGGIISLLPLSPFTTFESKWFGEIKFIEWVEWIIPIDAIMSLIGSFVFAVATYYIMKWTLSWLKLI